MFGLIRKGTMILMILVGTRYLQRIIISVRYIFEGCLELCLGDGKRFNGWSRSTSESAGSMTIVPRMTEAARNPSKFVYDMTKYK
jgi:hypothetical protein